MVVPVFKKCSHVTYAYIQELQPVVVKQSLDRPEEGHLGYSHLHHLCLRLSWSRPGLGGAQASKMKYFISLYMHIHSNILLADQAGA